MRIPFLEVWKHMFREIAGKLTIDGIGVKRSMQDKVDFNAAG